METRLIPWPSTQAPSQESLIRLMHEEGLSPYLWANGAHDVYAPHSHTYNKVIYCVSGYITFGLPAEHGSLTLRPGDRLELPAGTLHDSVVGDEGVLCLEAHK